MEKFYKRTKNGAVSEFDLAIPKARIFKILVYAFHHNGIERTSIDWLSFRDPSRGSRKN